MGKSSLINFFLSALRQSHWSNHSECDSREPSFSDNLVFTQYLLTYLISFPRNISLIAFRLVSWLRAHQTVHVAAGIVALLLPLVVYARHANDTDEWEDYEHPLHIFTPALLILAIFSFAHICVWVCLPLTIGVLFSLLLLTIDFDSLRVQNLFSNNDDGFLFVFIGCQK